MEEPLPSSFVNRDDPIPVLRVPLLEDETASPATVSDQKQRKRDALKDHAHNLKDKIEHARDEYKQAAGAGGIQERLLNSLMQQIIPVDIEEDGREVKDRRSRTYVDRPGFSLPLMSSNFRRFNARIGIAFVFQNRLIRLFGWQEPTHTLSFLAIYTLLCLQPALISIVPLALVLFFVMIPSFLTRHPPPPPPQDSADAAATERYAAYGYSGPPIAPPQRVKPAPEMSKDFFRNMRDLQNSMEDFSRVHDGAVAFISPYTDFSDERLSSAVFLAIVLLLSSAFLAAHLVPWRAVALIAGWTMVGAGHPKAQDVLLSTHSLAQIRELHSRVSTYLRTWIETDIALDEPPEIREVEIFELQKLQSSGLGIAVAPAADGTWLTEGEWEPWMFTPGPYDPMSPARISGARPTGTQFFEEVAPPRGWRWRDKKWSLDLASRAWVEERCVTGVEVETEGERWVYDIGYEDTDASGKGKGKKVASKSWEEGTGRGKKGEWRRRRWIRLVERKVVKGPDPLPKPSALSTLDPGMLNPGAIEPASIT